MAKSEVSVQELHNSLTSCDEMESYTVMRNHAELLERELEYACAQLRAYRELLKNVRNSVLICTDMIGAAHSRSMEARHEVS